MARFGGARGGGGFRGHASGFGRPRGNRIPNNRNGAHGRTYTAPHSGMPHMGRSRRYGNYGCMGCVVPVIGVILIIAAIIAAVVGLM